MVLVNVQVAIAMDGEVYHAVLAYLFQHVVEEAEPRLNIAMSVAVQVETYKDVGLFGGTTDFCLALATEGDGSSPFP